MTLLAYLDIRSRRLGRSGWFKFRHFKSSGALIDTMRRVHGTKVIVRTVLTER